MGSDARVWFPPVIVAGTDSRIHFLGFEFGAHSRTHRDLTSVSAEDLEDEITGSANDLPKILGRRTTSFAYPFGFTNEAVTKLAGDTFDLYLTISEGLNSEHTDRRLIRRLKVSSKQAVGEFGRRMRFGLYPPTVISRALGVRQRLGILGRRLTAATESAKL